MQNQERIPNKSFLFSIIDKVKQLSPSKGKTHVMIAAYWQGCTRWSRNRIGMSSNRTDYYVRINREIDGGFGAAIMNQIDDDSLSSAIDFADWQAVMERKDQRPDDFPLEAPVGSDPEAYVWAEKTAAYDFLDSGRIVRLTCRRAEDLSLMAAGNIECTSFTAAYVLYDPTSQKEYKNFTRLTRGNCSVTARNPRGLGSGWGGVSDIDFARVNEESIANKAFDKCLASMNPVRVEPGRYTVILEPQAVAGLIGPLLFSADRIMSRRSAEHPAMGSPFSLGYDTFSNLYRSKLGLKVFDERINVWHDPLDPEVGVVGFNYRDLGIKKTSYVENGVLVSLPYDRSYSVNRLEDTANNVHRMSFRMSGGDASIESMIETTERGFLITRFSGGSITDASALVASGLTRDGLWLIENGKIKSSVRNFRTLESPFFVLNNIEQIGQPEKVYTDTVQHSLFIMRVGTSGTRNFAPQCIVPSLKVRDFSFAATIDAV